MRSSSLGGYSVTSSAMRITILIWLCLVVVTAPLESGRRRQSPLQRAPERAAYLVNPYEGSADAVRAGAKLYRRHCAACHGEDAEGIGRKPSLRSAAIKSAAPGILFWLLKNGFLPGGMPSWSKLPDQRLWQIVTYLKSLKSPDSSEKRSKRRVIR